MNPTKPDHLGSVPLPPRYVAASRMREWFEAERLAPGALLPSERQLAAHLGVGRSVVRSALALLQAEGLIEAASKRSRRQFRWVGVRRERPAEGVLSETVVVLTPTPEPNPKHQQPGWVEQMVQGALHAVRAAEKDALALHPNRFDEAGLSRLIAARPLGILVPEAVVLRRRIESLVETFRRAGLPIVVYGGEQELAAYDRVTSDHELGARLATEWMLARGRRRVAMLWGGDPARHYWFPARRAGYENAMVRAGLRPLPLIRVPEWPPEDLTAERFEYHVRELIGFLMEVARETERPDALLCYTDYIVPYVAEALHRWGVHPNESIWLAGYDNYALELPERSFCRWLPMITVDKRNYEMGAAMARLLFERVEGRLPPEAQTRVEPPRLVELQRLSSG